MPGHRQRVEWDESNLAANAEYHRQHPVTRHIDEPKTPYVYINDEEPEEEEGQYWDPQVNAYARAVKERVTNDYSNATPAPVSSTGRPMLASGTLDGTLESDRQDREFKQMRKAVYADEGAKFKEMMARKAHGGDDDPEDEEDDGAEGGSGDGSDGEYCYNSSDWS